MTRMSLLAFSCIENLAGTLAYTALCQIIILIFCFAAGKPVLLSLIFALLCGAGVFLAGTNFSLPARCGWYNLGVMQKLLKRRAWVCGLKGKNLLWQNGAWEYSDSDSFVRINNASACILFAPDLNLKTQGIHTIKRITDPAMAHRGAAPEKCFHVYVFSLRDGSSVTVQIDRATEFLNWIASHGGKTVQK